MRFVAVENKPGRPSNYRGLTGGLDGIARSIVWDPRVKEFFDAGNLPALRWLIGDLVRKALDQVIRDHSVREPDGGTEPRGPEAEGLEADDLGGGRAP